MSKQDFRPLDSHRWSARPYQTKAGQTALNAGEICIQDTAGDEEYVLVAPDATDSDDVWVGVTASKDTVTASADGVVFVYDDPNTTFVGRPTTSANLASTIINTKVTLDVSGDVQTVDENDTTKGVMLIKGYDTARNEVYFRIDPTYHING